MFAAAVTMRLPSPTCQRWIAPIWLAIFALPVCGAELADAQKLLRTGRYEQCIDACDKSIKAGQSDEDIWLLKIRAELITGRNSDALQDI
jgi:hypothetical protein